MRLIPFDKRMLEGEELPGYNWGQLILNTWSAETVVTWATWL